LFFIAVSQCLTSRTAAAAAAAAAAAVVVTCKTEKGSPRLVALRRKEERSNGRGETSKG
jgi:hypothetical protein